MTQKFSITTDQLKVFETLPDPYLILSPNLHILTASNAYLEATFTVRDQIVGKSIFKVFPDNPDTPQANSVSNLKASFKEVLATGKSHRMALQRYDVPLPEGSGKFEKKYWQPLNTPVLDEKGEVIYIIHKVTDLTKQVEDNARIETLQEQQRQGKEQLENQRNLLKMLLDQAPVGICLSQGMDLVITSANPMICDMWGYKAEQVLEKPLLEAIPELRGQGFDALLQNVLLTGIPYQGREQAAQLLTNGKLETKYFNFIYLALKDEVGTTIGVLTVVVEVTEQVLARQQLEHSHHKVQSLNEELAAINEELSATNEELTEAKKALEILNTELEERIIERTKELKFAQQETEGQRQLLHKLFMEAPAPIVILDGEQLVYQLVNPAYQQIFPGRALLGKPLLEALPELEGTPIPAILDDVYRTGETFVAHELPLMMARHEGAPLEEIYWTFTYQARRNQQGVIDGSMVFAYEVTDQVKARQKVEDNARQLRLITDAMPVLIGYLDKEEKYRFANQAYQSWFNQDPEALLGRPVRDVVGEKAYGGVKQYMDRALAGERLDFEAKMPYRENFTKYIRTSYVPDVQNGEVAGFFTLVNDITEQVEIRQQLEEREKEAQVLAEELAASNEELRASSDQVQESNEMLTSSNQQLSYINADMDNFIYTASHDLRAPISNIEGLMNAILRTLPAESRQSPVIERLFGLVRDSIERFKRTIGDLSEITKIQREDTSQEVAQIDLAQIIREVQLDLSAQIEQADASFELHLNECAPIHFSAKNARSVVYNLISNAVKYRSPERPLQVQILCYQQGEFLVLHVQDNGLGMDLSDRTKIFAMFKRLHDHVEGSGIGLYIVKKIMENAQGKIEVESKIDEGSTFRVYFRQINNSLKTEESQNNE